MNRHVNAVVFDVHLFVNAVLGPDSDWPLLNEVPPTTDNAAADCLSIAFDAEEFSLFTSLHILRSTARVLAAAGWQHEDIEQYIDAITEIVETSGGEILDPPRAVLDVPDYEDNLILDLAMACDAWIVVSDDTDLTSLSPWQQRVAILRPHEFIRKVVATRRRQ